MWGVKDGLCLPRRRIATIDASRPTTRPLASMRSHFFSISAVLVEWVLPNMKIIRGLGARVSGAEVRARPIRALGRPCQRRRVGIAEINGLFSMRYQDTTCASPRGGIE